MGRYGRVGQATDDNIIRRMRFAFWITKDTDPNSEYVIHIGHCSNGYANAPQCYVYTCVACLLVSCCKNNVPLVQRDESYVRKKYGELCPREIMKGLPVSKRVTVESSSFCDS